MKRVRNFILILVFLVVSFLPAAGSVQAQSNEVRAVLFYSPTCGHCAQVINEVLPEMDQQFGTQLVIFGVNTYTEEGNTLFTNYIEAFEVAPEDQAVPTLVIGDQVLIGSADIPNFLPGIVEDGLASGGIDWPAIPGLLDAINQVPADPADPASDAGESVPTTELLHSLTIAEKFQSDLAGNILAVIVLAAMLVVMVTTGFQLKNAPLPDKKAFPDWLIPVLSLIGIGVAGYLAFVEANQVEAVCGPVGNCNAVQQSQYATLFGILPIGLLGVLGYLAIIILWLARILDLEKWNSVLDLMLFGTTLIGILFSTYLTFLEPFVIGATCMWCLSSAVIMTLLFLIAARKLVIQEQED